MTKRPGAVKFKDFQLSLVGPELKAGMAAFDRGREIAAERGEQAGDLLAEARAEYEEELHAPAVVSLRGSARYSMYQQPTLDFPQNISGFTDVTVNNIGVYGQLYNVNWTVRPSTFVEANYSRNTHAQSGCSVPGGSPTFCGGQGALAVSPKSNRDQAGMGALPYIFPNAFNIDPSYWAYQVLNSVKLPWWDGTTAHMVPTFAWGNRITNWCSSCETALSDLEVIHSEEQGHLWYINYPLVPLNDTDPPEWTGDERDAVDVATDVAVRDALAAAFR